MLTKLSLITSSAFLIALFSGQSQADFQANSYQECLLEATRDGLVTTKKSIGSIKEACRQRHPDSVPDLAGIKLSKDALQRVDVWTHRDNDDNIKGSIYNGNSDVIITQLILLITPRGTDDPIQSFFDSEEYEINLRIPPFKTEHFEISIKDTAIKEQFRWSLVNAFGY